MPKAYSSDFFVSAAVCLSKIVQMYASDLLFCHFKQGFGFCWDVDIQTFHSALRVLMSFLTSRMSVALVFLFAGYCFQASRTGFSRMEIEIVTCFVIFSPRWMSLGSLFLMVCMTIWVRWDCLSYEQYF